MALNFLVPIFAANPTDTYILLWQLRYKRSHWFRGLDPAAALVERLRSEDLYVGVGLAANRHGPNERCKASCTVGIPALWIDLDIAGTAHQKPNLPPTIEDALRLIPTDLPPSMIVHTGHGVQCWWLLREPWLFANSEERVRAADLARRFNLLFKLRAKERGWDVDSVSDLARVLRIPGSTNTKIHGAHCPVYVYRDSQHRYGVTELQGYLDAAGIDDVQNGRCRRAAATRQSDDSWVELRPDANPPSEKFQLLCEIEPRFLRSWKHKRKDLQDQSPSAYDMSLATFAARVMWSDQEVADLLIAHRRKHDADLKLRQDYYRRTIEKARAAAAAYWSGLEADVEGGEDSQAQQGV
jgi:hypothetical protein